MNNLKLAFCTNGIFPHAVGGMQKHSRMLLEKLGRDDRLNITVIHPHSEEIFKEYSNISEIRIQGIDKDKTYLFELYRYSKRIASTLIKLDTDVIYSQGFSVWYDIEEFTKKLIINPHGLEPFQGITFKDKLIGFPFQMVQKYLFRRARYTVSLGGKLTSILKDIIPNDNIVVLPNAVKEPNINNSISFSKGSEQDPLNILFVGRFAKNKGIHLLMEAVQNLNKKGYQNKFHFNLAGKGPLYDVYNSKYKIPNVDFLGFVSDEELKLLYKNSDLFVLPTLFEGMPTVVLEAMSHSLPILVTDVGATAELVSDLNGFLIEKNNVGQLEDSLLNFLNYDIEKKKQLGNKSLEKVINRFTWEKVAQEHLNLFNTLS